MGPRGFVDSDILDQTLYHGIDLLRCAKYSTLMVNPNANLGHWATVVGVSTDAGIVTNVLCGHGMLRVKKAMYV